MKFLEVFGSFPTFSKFFEVFQCFSKFFKVFRSFSKFFEVFQSFSKFFEVFRSFSKFFKVFRIEFLDICFVYAQVRAPGLRNYRFSRRKRPIFEISNWGLVTRRARVRGPLSLKVAPGAASAKYVRFRVWASPNPHVTCLCRSQARPVSDRARAAARLWRARR